jgi:glycosyltransferase involved in cell wall biosynthesis/thiamine kinase-like enzyme
LLASASRHEVWVLTNNATIPIVRRAIEEYPWADRVHLEGIYFDVDDELYPQLTSPGFHRYYDRWQRKAARRAVELDKQMDFDLIHHVTLAASWTRTGVTAVDKPLVWGPVGGAVETPLALLPELGWRGLLDEAGRVTTRRLLMRIGPARRTQQRAVFTFAQNIDTARVLRTHGVTRVLSNATAVDVRDVHATGPRGTDIIFAGRLLPWKGARLAVRAIRYIRHPDAVLRIFGDGPERRRIARAVRSWGIADRVRFEGRVRRDELLRIVATAGVFFHPAFHDEAGLGVAEALSLGTPVVCLDRGGPSELLRHWPTTLAHAVRPQSPERTARALAAAIDRCLSNPPCVPATPRQPNTSFQRELLAAYDIAFQAHHDRAFRPTTGWAFPAGKPQVFADTPRSLSTGVTVYGFGRRLPHWTQRALAMQVRVPILRRLVAEPTPSHAPVCGWTTWRAVREEVCRRNAQSPLEWIHFQSQWEKQRSSMLGLDRVGTIRWFVVVQPKEADDFRSRVPSTRSFRVTACVDSFVYDAWSVRQYEPLPRFHRPAQWNPARIRRVAEDVSLALNEVLPPASGVPPHWRPIHGDYVPWNLREDDQGQLWLLDWEHARWGPPLADLVRYIVAYHSLGWSSIDRIAGVVRRTVGPESLEALAEVATFWLSHENLQFSEEETSTRQKAKDSARAAREVAVFKVLVSS